MRDFVAIDFETANSSRSSVCSVGMVFVKNNMVRETMYQLINPEVAFHPVNTSIHGITEEDVADSPTFGDFYHEVKDKLANQLFVAHFLPFDGYVLRDSINRYGLTPVPKQLLCSYQLSKKLLPGLPSYTLKSMCHHFDIELANHHHALDDAKACADLFARLIELNNIENEEVLHSKTGIRVGELTESSFQTSRASKKGGGAFNLSSIEVNKDADSQHAFYGKKVVFTGKLELFSRKQAAEMVAAMGGFSQNGINHETDYIIIGGLQSSVPTGRKSSKLIQAEKMIKAGHSLEIINEEAFLKMLG